MPPINIIVTVLSLSLIGFIAWFFFGPKTHQQAAMTAQSGVKSQRVTIVVKGGYSPSAITVKKDVSVTVTFDRKESGECTEYVYFDKRITGQTSDLSAHLPAFQQTNLVFVPKTTGTFDFVCGMGMVHGKITVTS